MRKSLSTLSPLGPSRFCAFALNGMAAGALVVVTSVCLGDHAAPQSTTLPVILLTGFEPFGPARPPNPSWEGVKSLDGQEWNGFRLVARQLPVVWGQPKQKLEEWIAELQPVAILSFGQGAPGAFAIETRAANQRGGSLDNAGQRAPAASIIADGPLELQATFDCQQLSKRLAEKGYSVRLSTRAGGYLCEEMLYTLEYLKTKQSLSANVLFCHVPPLGPKVTVECVHGFVREVLTSWQAIYQPEAPDTKATEPKERDDPRQAEVRRFIERYFSTWSNREMDAYAEGFLPEAVIHFLDVRGRASTQQAKEFLAEQRRYQAQTPAKEVPLTIDIRFEARLARAVVYWRLDSAGQQKFGYDHFTLVQRDGQWRILHLVFYETERR